MAPQEPDPLAAHSVVGGASDALIETSLTGARITVLSASRLGLVSEAVRTRIDAHGVACQPLSDLRVTVPLPPAATSDPELHDTLARWAAQQVMLHGAEVVVAGERFTRAVTLADDLGHEVRLDAAHL